MRPKRAYVADWPGTVVVGNSRTGTCGACYLRAGKSAETARVVRQPEPLDPCSVCDKPMRHMHVRAADAPGTVEIRNYETNTCVTCVRRPEGSRTAAQVRAESTSRANQRAAVAVQESKTVEQNAAGLAAYFAERRALGVAVEGLPFEIARTRRGREAVRL